MGSYITQGCQGYILRRYKREFIQFLTYSLVSCDETREHLELLYDTKSMKNKEQFEYFLSGYEEIGAKIMKFTQAVERGHLVPKS